MGQPVVHFEVVGRDGDKLQGFYSALFGWDFEDVGGPMNYRVVQRDGNTTPDGVGIGGGVGGFDGHPGHVTFYVEVPDLEATLDEVESRGGKRLMGPDEVPGQGILIGQFSDPEGHVIGAVQPVS